MNFNKHFALNNKHAFLSPSQYHWMNYDQEKLEARWKSHRNAVRGTELHALANSAIKLGVKLSHANRALSGHVNDAIGYKMSSEQSLYYSDNAFGQADAIGFRRKMLRIHDYKSGVGKTSVRQLEGYAALFCLEYSVDPFEIQMEFRIYQHDTPEIFDGDPEVIAQIMDTIIEFDTRIEFMKERDLL